MVLFDVSHGRSLGSARDDRGRDHYFCHVEPVETSTLASDNEYLFRYIMANLNHSVLYIGMTNNLEKRIWEHKNKVDSKCFTAKYNCIKLVYYETTTDVESCIAREKQLKNWSRIKKVGLIERVNSHWLDLTGNWNG